MTEQRQQRQQNISFFHCIMHQQAHQIRGNIIIIIFCVFLFFFLKKKIPLIFCSEESKNKLTLLVLNFIFQYNFFKNKNNKNNKKLATIQRR